MGGLLLRTIHPPQEVLEAGVGAEGVGNSNLKTENPLTHEVDPGRHFLPRAELRRLHEEPQGDERPRHDGTPGGPGTVAGKYVL